MTDGMELPNHDKIRTFGENETYKYLGILEADTIKQMEMKDYMYLEKKEEEVLPASKTALTHQYNGSKTI